MIDAVEEVLAETVALARNLTPADGERLTDCPGWTVKDNLAHMVGLEQALAGAPEPTIEIPEFEHVRNDVGVYMEGHVHIRRALPMVAIADELAGMLPRRIAQLRALAASGDPMVPGPLGVRPLSKSLPVRVFDLWAHEQDIRRAVGQLPRIDGVSSAMALRQSLHGWSGGLPRAELGIDAELVIEVTGPEPSTTSIVLGAGGSTATLRGDLGELTRVFCGRGPLDANLLSGDAALVAAIAGHLAMTP